MARHANAATRQSPGRSRAGVVTARALRFGLHPTGVCQREADVLVTLAGGDPEVLVAARHRIGGGHDQLVLDVGAPDAGRERALRDATRAGSVQIDRVRAHALEVLALAEAQARGRSAA